MTPVLDPCPIYRPDHNGECLLCDEYYDEHSPEAVALGERLAASDVGMVARLREELVKANLKVESLRAKVEHYEAAHGLPDICCPD